MKTKENKEVLLVHRQKGRQGKMGILDKHFMKEKLNQSRKNNVLNKFKSLKKHPF